MKSDDFAFANDVRAALEERAPRSAWIILGATLTLFAAALIWASWAVIEQSTTADGRVIPSRQLQVVQSLEGGVVRAIDVAEGDIVEPGQRLIEIDDTTLAARLGELHQRRNSLRATRSRLEAELAGAGAFDPDPALRKAAPDAVRAEQQVFRARATELESAMEVVRQRLVQKEHEVDELAARETQLSTTIVPIQRELDLTRDLTKRGIVPEIELLRLERQFSETDGELSVIRAARPRAMSAVEEARGELAARRAAFRAEAQTERARTVADLAVIDEQIKAATDRVTRTALRAPVRGVVNRVNVTTIGGVVQPGQALVEIVPLDDTLLIEARVRPKDVAFIHPGQPASVRLTAYDYRLYGGLEGRVERIGADTVADPSGETFYRVVVRTDQTHITDGQEKLPIIPGMVATVDIQGGERTVLDYILKPIGTIRQEALRER